MKKSSLALLPLLFTTALIAAAPARAEYPEEVNKASAAEPRMAGVEQKSADVNGTTIAYKIAGKGPVIVLLHGYAETSAMWLPVMGELMKTHTVIAPDLRGAGRSKRTESGYDKKSMAQDIHALLEKIGPEYNLDIRNIEVAGHDIGLMVAYAYAAQYPKEVKKLVLMDAFLPGVGDTTGLFLLRDLWHFHFYGETPEALVKGRERIYFEHFWNDFAADKTRSLPEADRALYSSVYAADNGMHAGFQYFKNFDQDAKDNQEFMKTKLEMPVLVITGEKASGQGLIDQAKMVANNVTGDIVPNSGHWLMEEAPQHTIESLVEFLK